MWSSYRFTVYCIQEGAPRLYIWIPPFSMLQQDPLANHYGVFSAVTELAISYLTPYLLGDEFPPNIPINAPSFAPSTGIFPFESRACISAP